MIYRLLLGIALFSGSYWVLFGIASWSAQVESISHSSPLLVMPLVICSVIIGVASMCIRGHSS